MVRIFYTEVTLRATMVGAQRMNFFEKLPLRLQEMATKLNNLPLRWGGEVGEGVVLKFSSVAWVLPLLEVTLRGTMVGA